ncbi:MAG TPA: hypothetical protein VFS20_27635 [Longimicrobium sp.]|nr:hypothetical protein [Longimicrobium sp.]
MHLLREMSDIERGVRRRGKHRSAFLAHNWSRVDGVWHTVVTEICYPAASVPIEVLPPNLIWILRIGVDNPQFERDTPDFYAGTRASRRPVRPDVAGP